MRFTSLLTAVCALFTVSVMFTAIAVLGSLSQSADIRSEDLEAGRLLPMFMGPTFWSHYPQTPQVPPLSIDWNAGWFALGVVALGLLLSCSRLRCSIQTVAIVSQIAGAIPYATGAIVLRATAHSPVESGIWVSIMLHGVLYSSFVSMAWTLIDVLATLRTRFPIRNEVSICISSMEVPNR
ncbi:MAG: hypothetical protein KDB14_13650 [Planctomycetales bacterium]|nr:hypothetical protein [Planctomycetales bacterium]